MPPNTVYVGRPTKWGNPFDYRKCSRKKAVQYYQRAIKRPIGIYLAMWRHEIKTTLHELKGKNLACWCPILKDGLYVPCHADVLISLANAMSKEDVINENFQSGVSEETTKSP